MEYLLTDEQEEWERVGIDNRRDEAQQALVGCFTQAAPAAQSIAIEESPIGGALGRGRANTTDILQKPRSDKASPFHGSRYHSGSVCIFIWAAGGCTT